MRGKIKWIIIAAVILVAGALGYQTVMEKMTKDPQITGLQAEFVGEVPPGGKLTKSMFKVRGITPSGKLVELKDFTSQTGQAAANGATCEIEIEAQGYSATAIINITRPVVTAVNIGYPNEEAAQATLYENGDLELTGSGDIQNFGNMLPWTAYQYSHVYIDDTLNITNMDSWFEGNQDLVYCSDLPKSVKTMRYTFQGCSSLEKTPEYFQCSGLKIMDYAFSDCVSLKEIDTLPVNVTSARYTFANNVSLQDPVDLSKTSNLSDISGIHDGCTGLRKVAQVPETVSKMSESFAGCINVKEATKFPDNVQYIDDAYAGCSGLQTGASIPESAVDISGCYSGCASLCGTLEINSDTESFNGFLQNAVYSGDKLSISGNSGNLLAIQKNAGNSNIMLADAEAAAQQNERMIREQGGEMS